MALYKFRIIIIIITVGIGVKQLSWYQQAVGGFSQRDHL